MGVSRIAIAVAVVALGIGVAASEAGAAAKKPDAMIRVLGDPTFFGNNLYRDDGLQSLREPGPGPVTFEIRVKNGGTAVDSFRIFGTGIQNSSGGPESAAAIDTGDITVRFKLQGQDVTEKVAAGRLKFRDIAPGASSPKLRMIVEAENGASGGGAVFASSLKNSNREDGVGGTLVGDEK